MNKLEEAMENSAALTTLLFDLRGHTRRQEVLERARKGAELIEVEKKAREVIGHLCPNANIGDMIGSGDASETYFFHKKEQNYSDRRKEVIGAIRSANILLTRDPRGPDAYLERLAKNIEDLAKETRPRIVLTYTPHLSKHELRTPAADLRDEEDNSRQVLSPSQQVSGEGVRIARTIMSHLRETSINGFTSEIYVDYGTPDEKGTLKYLFGKKTHGQMREELLREGLYVNEIFTVGKGERERVVYGLKVGNVFDKKAQTDLEQFMANFDAEQEKRINNTIEKSFGSRNQIDRNLFSVDYFFTRKSYKALLTNLVKVAEELKEKAESISEVKINKEQFKQIGKDLTLDEYAKLEGENFTEEERKVYAKNNARRRLQAMQFDWQEDIMRKTVAPRWNEEGMITYSLTKQDRAWLASTANSIYQAAVLIATTPVVINKSERDDVKSWTSGVDSKKYTLIKESYTHTLLQRADGKKSHAEADAILGDNLLEAVLQVALERTEENCKTVKGIKEGMPKTIYLDREQQEVIREKVKSGYVLERAILNQ